MSDYTKFDEPVAHPGEHLREDYLPAFGLTPDALAECMGLKDHSRVLRLVHEAAPVTPDMSLRLARVFGTNPDFWLTLQSRHDLSKAAIAHRAELAKIKTLAA
ncbi:MAG TPA: HigA family addiction module antitoxin [Caulobacteraceae bacterium]|jgi:addiction module HigA family antidote|nr:HigA family addiction module antitoxin [Caulobacteraceae bacterium]